MFSKRKPETGLPLKQNIYWKLSNYKNNNNNDIMFYLKVLSLETCFFYTKHKNNNNNNFESPPTMHPLNIIIRKTKTLYTQTLMIYVLNFQWLLLFILQTHIIKMRNNSH